ncbi:hypothetical protein GCM10011588_43210 [Nocardia jinanensis]|uniref:Uncharacterized protein n=1 Tax=Nocardia jinanensis TaxID=382504 RepID=A0A917RSY9_9NOCA|nr:hypothetical protein GCM10011588_43210 [Nocardia jinanensis]
MRRDRPSPDRAGIRGGRTAPVAPADDRTPVRVSVQLGVPGVGVPGSDAGIVTRSATSIPGQLFPGPAGVDMLEFELAGV